MGEAVIPSLTSIGVQCLRINNEDEVETNIEAALTMVFKAERSVAVLLSQKLIGAKSF